MTAVENKTMEAPQIESRRSAEYDCRNKIITENKRSRNNRVSYIFNQKKINAVCMPIMPAGII